MRAFDVVVAGAGIAGLSAAAELSRDRRVLLVDPEPVIAAHASGRNAAIYRPLDEQATTAELSRRSLALLDGLVEQGREAILSRTGVLLAARDPAALDELRARARLDGVQIERLGSDELATRLPVLGGGECRDGLLVGEGGVLDIHAISSALAAAARRGGAELHLGTGLVGLERTGERPDAVLLDDGGRIVTGSIVIAAGAWTPDLGRALGAEALPLSPLRRHLVQLAVEPAPARGSPVIWRVDDEVYFRAEGDGLLASPCDETPSHACAPAADPAALELLHRKLCATAPALRHARVRSSWACLRTFAPDRELVVGADPRAGGVYWMTGFGGRGMGVAPAAAEILRAAIDGEHHPLADAVAPHRLV